MLEVEVENRSGASVDAPGAVALAREVLAAEGVEEGELGIAFVTAEEMRALEARAPRDRRADRRPLVPDRRARVAAARASRARSATSSSAPRWSGDEWRWPLVHGLLHLLGHEHGSSHGSAGARALAVISPRRPPSIFESFNYALEGIIHVLRTQRNMRIHFGAAVAVLVAALAFDVSRLELIALLIAIAFVLIAEMINTAVEAAVDVASTSFDPMAKLAKDIGAGAVLIAAVNAIAVGYLVFSGQVAEESSRLLDKLSEAPAELTLIALVLTTALVIALKALSGRGSPLRGGWPSGHAAVAFAGWMAVTLVLEDTEHRFLVSSLTLIMALLVAQTRIEAGVHSTLEVASGGLLGALVTLVDLPGVLRVTDEELLARRRRGRGAGVRAVLALPRRLRRARAATAAWSRASTSRTPRTRSASARSVRRSPAPSPRGIGRVTSPSPRSPPRRAAAAASGSRRCRSSGSCSGTGAASWR